MIVVPKIGVDGIMATYAAVRWAELRMAAVIGGAQWPTRVNSRTSSRSIPSGPCCV
jgi:hypothetical protein